jgi:hypothetical protein
MVVSPVLHTESNKNGSLRMIGNEEHIQNTFFLPHIQIPLPFTFVWGKHRIQRHQYTAESAAMVVSPVLDTEQNKKGILRTIGNGERIQNLLHLPHIRMLLPFTFVWGKHRIQRHQYSAESTPMVVSPVLDTERNKKGILRIIGNEEHIQNTFHLLHIRMHLPFTFVWGSTGSIGINIGRKAPPWW